MHHSGYILFSIPFSDIYPPYPRTIRFSPSKCDAIRSIQSGEAASQSASVKSSMSFDAALYTYETAQILIMSEAGIFADC
jgi:hypothetical protein